MSWGSDAGHEQGRLAQGDDQLSQNVPYAQPEAGAKGAPTSPAPCVLLHMQCGRAAAPPASHLAREGLAVQEGLGNGREVLRREGAGG
jgi:hypothetical protein